MKQRISVAAKAMVATSIRLRFDGRSIHAVRLQFDRATTIRRPTLRP